MLSKRINLVPIQGRMNIIQAAVFNLNMRLLALGRQQLSIVNRDNDLFAVPEGIADEESTFQSPGGGNFRFGNDNTLTPQELEVRHATGGAPAFGQHVDGANAITEKQRATEGSAAVTHEQGHDAPANPLLQAEPFVALRDMLLLKYYDEASKTRRRPLDQSYASIINWMHGREFMPNTNEAQAVFMASKGRVSVEQAIIAQKRRHEDEKKRLAKIAEPLLKTMEDFNGLDLSGLLDKAPNEAVRALAETPSLVDGDIIIDTIFESLPGITRLGIVNVMWRRCHRLVTDDFPSKRIPTQDFAGDIALAIGAEDEFLGLAKELLNLASEEYAARKMSGLPEYDVVREIEAQLKSAAQVRAKASGPLAKPVAA